jgi:hypothetical protein
VSHFSVATFLLLTAEARTPEKDMSSACTSASAEAESACVVTLSNIFENQCRFYGFLSLDVGHIASDSSGIDILRTSELPRREATSHQRS